jgi:hypothetical protein
MHADEGTELSLELSLAYPLSVQCLALICKSLPNKRLPSWLELAIGLGKTGYDEHISDAAGKR